MNITEHLANDVLVINPEGKITLGNGNQELGEAIRTTLEKGNRKILINFAKVNILDPPGQGELLGCYQRIKQPNGILRICGLNERIFNLMQMTSLHSVFDVKDTEAEALAAF